jgi:hypothetical protein
MRRALIDVKFGRKILLDAGFSTDIIASRFIVAGRNKALMNFNV